MESVRNRRSRRRVLHALSVAASGGLAGCSTSDDDPDESPSDDDSTDQGEASATPSESELESIFRSWVEFESREEMRELIHPDSGLLPIEPYAEQEFVRIQRIEEESEDAVVAVIEKRRASDGTTITVEIELRPHEDDWLVFNTDTN